MDYGRVQNLELQKERIKQFIDINGPSLPVHISNHLKLDSLLSSAFLSDLLSDKELKISSLRVGNSPVYYMQGQEFQLEKFANFLPGKEREAFYLLKEQGVLKDTLMLPAIRVALRAIKDFSFPLEYNSELYWRFIKVNEQQAFDLIDAGKSNFSQLPKSYQSSIKSVEIVQSQINVQPVIPPKIEENIVIKSEPVIIEPAVKTIEPIFEKSLEIAKEEIALEIKEVKTKKSRTKILSEFLLKVNSFFQKENILVITEIKKGKKEYMAVVGVDKGESERTEYLCIAKEKKSVSDKELMKQLQLGQKKNLPVLFVSSGEASKKAVDWLDYLGNVIIYKKME